MLVYALIHKHENFQHGFLSRKRPFIPGLRLTPRNNILILPGRPSCGFGFYETPFFYLVKGRRQKRKS
jgi:hypothetical protein